VQRHRLLLADYIVQRFVSPSNPEAGRRAGNYCRRFLFVSLALYPVSFLDDGLSISSSCIVALITTAAREIAPKYEIDPSSLRCSALNG